MCTLQRGIGSNSDSPTRHGVATKKTSGRSHGFRHKSRSVMTKKRPRGVSFLLREYSVGDRALVIIDPRQHKGLPHRRYHGKVGIVTETGRRMVTLHVKLGKKTKTLITRLDHIKPFGVQA